MEIHWNTKEKNNELFLRELSIEEPLLHFSEGLTFKEIRKMLHTGYTMHPGDQDSSVIFLFFSSSDVKFRAPYF